jgi:hypothetical protein
MKKNLISLALSCLFTVALSGCGGGGGGSQTSQPPAPPQAPIPLPTIDLSANPTSVTAGQTTTLTWSAQNTGASSCRASGAWSGEMPTSGTKEVQTQPSSSGYTASFTLTCGSTVKTTSVAVSAPAPLASNSVPVTVEAGPSGSGRHINVPYVDVTICKPGTNTCQTISHVLLDTGSYGLRVFGPLDSSLSLDPVKSAAGSEIGQCGQFVSGYTWGSVVKADIKLGGELASSQSIQVVGGAPGGASNAPSSCANTGTNIGTVNALGARGILGVGLFKYDCGTACANVPISGVYYQCANGSCSSSTMPLSQQVSNPVASFAVNNNGVMLDLPGVPSGGAATVKGKILFGINTQPNNSMDGFTKYSASYNGHLSTTYKGTVMTSSFIDSGSNGLFFNDASLAKCTVSTDFYCPPTPVTANATIAAADGTASTPVQLTIESIDQLNSTITAASIGAPYGATNTFDWGLPFFFGRKVFVGIESQTASAYWAF